MQATELVARYRGAGGTVHAVGVDAAAALVGVERVQPYDGTRAAAEVDLLVVSAPDGPGLRALVPTDLPVGCHVALLAAGGAGNLPVGLLLDVLGDARVQVVDAVALAGSGEATVAVVGVRTDTALVPPPSHADAVVSRVASGDAALSRLVGEAVLARVVHAAHERDLALEIEAARALATEKGVAGLQRELEGTRKELARLRASRAYRVSSRVASAVRRVRHPLR